MNIDDTITVREAYKAMYIYLEELYNMTESEDLGEFLGSMSLLEDGMPADEAMWEDWLDAVKKCKLKGDLGLNIDNA